MNDRRARWVVLAGLVAVLSARVAWANAGTPLMWTASLHLFIGNAIIGIGEGILVSVFFRASMARSLALLVLANYVSSWAGALALGLETETRATPWLLGNEPLYHVGRVLLIFTLASFVASVVLEWPFIGLALGRRPHRWRTAALASLFAQTASYAVLVPFYLLGSDISLWTQTKPDRSLAFAKGAPAWVYFIAPGGEVWRVRPDGSRRAKVATTTAPAENTQLFARRNQPDAAWDLWVRWPSSGEHGWAAIVRPAFATGPVSEYEGEQTDDEEHESGLIDADLRPLGAREWTWIGQRPDLGLETPWLGWRMGSPVVLPGDLVVISLEDGRTPPQIVILDIHSRRIGLLARGSGVLVALDQSL